jgi:hypothetical protein
MPRYSQYCPVCGWQDEIYAAPFQRPPCPHCGGETDRLWVQQSAAMRQDSWEGGKTFENLGPEPVTLYSRTELKAELEKRGLQEAVRHVPVPGSDRSPHTTRWDVPCQKTLENARILLERCGASAPEAPGPRLGVRVDRALVEAAYEEAASQWPS